MIIDPLDGTTNFIHGFPVYCVSIALAVRGKVEQAVVYDPTRNDIYCATKGRGAYLNDRRIRVAKRARLQECLVSTGFPYRPGDKLKPYLNMLGEVMSQCAGVRRPGAAALDLAYVAAGYSDGFFESGLQLGTWRPARCWSRRLVAWSATSPAKANSWTRANVSPAIRAFTASW